MSHSILSELNLNYELIFSVCDPASTDVCISIIILYDVFLFIGQVSCFLNEVKLLVWKLSTDIACASVMNRSSFI